MDYLLSLFRCHSLHLNTLFISFIFYVSQYKDKDFSFSVQNGNAKIPSLSNDKRRDFWIKNSPQNGECCFVLKLIVGSEYVADLVLVELFEAIASRT